MNKHKFFEWSEKRRGELWLDYGNINRTHNDWHDTFWYNEDNANEWKYFVKGIFRQLKCKATRSKSRRMFFRIWVWHFLICFHITSKSSPEVRGLDGRQTTRNSL